LVTFTPGSYNSVFSSTAPTFDNLTAAKDAATVLGAVLKRHLRLHRFVCVVLLMQGVDHFVKVVNGE
jgi:hypothetical protein